ncbi:MAG TPA: hypothetical protein VGF84_11370 [Micromonosporaceae bacterium]|jgi:hypothetical protein
MSDRNLTSTDQAAAEVQAPSTQAWADDMSINRCTSTHSMTTPSGENVPVRCDATAGHAGNRHQCHYDGRIVHWAG